MNRSEEGVHALQCLAPFMSQQQHIKVALHNFTNIFYCEEDCVVAIAWPKTRINQHSQLNLKQCLTVCSKTAQAHDTSNRNTIKTIPTFPSILLPSTFFFYFFFYFFVIFKSMVTFIFNTTQFSSEVVFCLFI